MSGFTGFPQTGLDFLTTLGAKDKAGSMRTAEHLGE